MAIRRNQTDLSLLLARSGGNLTSTDPDGHTPLMSAVLFGNTDLVHGLMSLGADPNAKSNCLYTAKRSIMYTPFTWACDIGTPKIINTMLQAKFKQTQCNYPDIEDAIQFMLHRRNNLPRGPKALDMLFIHGANVTTAYKTRELKGSHESITHRDMAVLIRAGLPIEQMSELCKKWLISALNEAATLWMLHVLKKSHPMCFIKHEDELRELLYSIANELDNVEDSANKQKLYRNKRSIEEIVLFSIPSLYDFCVSTVRHLLFIANKGISITYLSTRLQGDIPDTLCTAINLDRQVPNFFHTMNSDEKEVTEWKKFSEDLTDTTETVTKQTVSSSGQCDKQPSENANYSERNLQEWGIIEEYATVKRDIKTNFSRPICEKITNYPYICMFTGYFNITDVCLVSQMITDMSSIDGISRHQSMDTELQSIHKFAHVETSITDRNHPYH